MSWLPNPQIEGYDRAYAIALAFYLVLVLVNAATGSQWWIDAAFSAALIILAYVLHRWLRLGWTGFLLLNVALLMHNVGAWGAYGLSWAGLGYDNFQHFLSSAVAAYIVFNFVARKLHVRKDEVVERTIVDEHTALLVFLVFASVAAMGVFVELLEFSGYVVLGEGEGILFAGSGDVDTLYGNDGNYVDTMTDVVFNTLGCLLGTLAYYFGTWRAKPWLRY